MPRPASAPIPLDALVIGGGIAGLWTLAMLRNSGRAAVLVEADALGSGQTVAAQGIIHGGLKYALNGVVGADARAIASMPSRWMAACESPAFPDPKLSKAAVRSHATWLWGSPSVRGRLGLLGARAGLQTRPERVEPTDQPEAIAPLKTACFRVSEPVFDPRVVLKELSDTHRSSIVKVDGPEAIAFSSRGGRVSEATLIQGEHCLCVAPEKVLFCAGKGNEGLRTRLGLPGDATQRRPLQMVTVEGALPELYGHCVDGHTTRLTITSTAQDAAGHRTWQLGGALAERGVARPSAELIDLARQELAELLPHLDFSQATFGTYEVDRAEVATPRRGRPEDISIRADGDGCTLTCFPTKMALAPRLADAVLPLVPAVHPVEPLLEGLTPFARPSVAAFPWETKP